jgi:hypothetical protein
MKLPSIEIRPTAARIVSFLIAPVDALPLRIFESLFCLAFLIRLNRNAPWDEWLTADGFHLTAEEWTRLGYPASFPLLPSWGVPVFGVLIAAACILVWCNRARRAALWVLLGCAIYAQSVDYVSATSANKLFIGVFALLATGPGIMADPVTGRAMVSAAMIRAIQATLIVQYFAAGVSKCDPGDWLKYSDVLWTQIQGVHRTDLAAWLLRTLPMWAWTAQQYTALGFELFAPLLFTIRRLRPLAFVLGIGFHLLIALTMHNLIFFSAQMWTFYALFLRAEEWRNLRRYSGLKRLSVERSTG